MTGKQIAQNLRDNAKKWIQNYYHSKDKTGEDLYCVIGLKLHELGVDVNDWRGHRNEERVGILAARRSVYIPNAFSLEQLQRANDRAKTVEEVIAYAEANGDVNYPLEELAEALKAKQA